MSTELLEDLRATTRQALSVDGGGDVVDMLDLAGLLIDGDRGGLGMGEREMVLVGEEIGRSTASSSFLPTVVLAPTLLGAFGHPHHVVVLAGNDGSWSTVSSTVATAKSAGGWRVTGAAWGLTTPSAPSGVLTPASTHDGTALFLVDLDRVALTAADELDPGRGLVEVVLDDAKARCVAEPSEAQGLLEMAYRRALLAVGAEQLGVARASLETTVEYAKTRSQFGAPIGSFQAIKHRCAEVLLATELADAVLQQAIKSGGHVDAELAFVVATRAAVSAAESCIHVHGGIGFTWEHAAHWYLRRARVNATMLGAPGVHRRAIAESAGLALMKKEGR